MKRKLIEDGTIMDPANRPPKYIFHWEYGDITGDCLCDNKSEARAVIKKDLGISKKKRLPKEVIITCEENDVYRVGLAQGYVNLQSGN